MCRGDNTAIKKQSCLDGVGLWAIHEQGGREMTVRHWVKLKEGKKNSKKSIPPTLKGENTLNTNIHTHTLNTNIHTHTHTHTYTHSCIVQHYPALKPKEKELKATYPSQTPAECSAFTGRRV